MDCLRVTLRRAAGSYFIFRLVLMNIFDELNNQTQSSVDNNSHEKQQVGDDLDFIFFGRERERDGTNLRVRNPSNAANFDPNISVSSVCEVWVGVPVHCEDLTWRPASSWPTPAVKMTGSWGRSGREVRSV